ncbi:MAG: signal recognition particle-docking protein FtsY [Acidimicrobiia bacterium]|nr:signal recognition particle-docking protein FtsY [Acidimicrobiia bacterium]
MEWLYIVIALLVVALVAFWLVRTRRGGAPPAATPTPAAAPPAPVGLRDRLAKTRRALSDRLGGVFNRSGFDADFWSDIEDSLVAADVGVGAASRAVEAVRGRNPEDPSAVRDLLARELVAQLAAADRHLEVFGEPSVVLVVGVNGSGKTTTIAKLAQQINTDSRPVLLGAADTFRAAAADQLKAWAGRIGVDIVAGESGADPASVAYDSFHAAKARGAGVVIVDTAGRLHSKSNLMDELGKVARVLRREAGDIDEVLLVLDGTTGQNAIEQARVFTEAVGVTGIVLTKLDGTARGGVAIAVEQELDIPVKYIGVGEAVEDLIPFDPEAFVDALLGA